MKTLTRFLVLTFLWGNANAYETPVHAFMTKTAFDRSDLAVNSAKLLFAIWVLQGASLTNYLQKRIAMKRLFFLSIILLSGFTSAQEICGFPTSLIKSGFERAEQPASAILPPENTAVSINVQGPANGSVVGVNAIQVYGTYSGPANTGIAVNGVPALTDGSSFVSPRILLEPGVNTLSIRYATLDAAPVTITRTVNYMPSALPDVLLAARSPGDYAPILVPFTLATKLPSGQNQITNVRIDFNGDGIFEVNGAAPIALEYAYENAGLYVPTAIVTFDDGLTPTAPVVIQDQARVMAQNLAFTRQTLCGVYYTMKSRLLANQISLAVNTQSPMQQTRMTNLWTALSNAGRLNAVATRLGPIVDGQITRNTAELMIAISTATSGVFDGFQVRFRKDENGVWRIDAM